MPLYLSRFSYTPETWARLVRNPEDRRKAAQTYIESVGGKLHGFWYAFGTHDGYNVWEAPDNVSIAAVALAISGGGALSSFETTVLLTVDETMAALRQAGQVRYQVPGAKRTESGWVRRSCSWCWEAWAFGGGVTIAGTATPTPAPGCNPCVRGGSAAWGWCSSDWYLGSCL